MQKFYKSRYKYNLNCKRSIYRFQKEGRRGNITTLRKTSHKVKYRLSRKFRYESFVLVESAVLKLN